MLHSFNQQRIFWTGALDKRLLEGKHNALNQPNLRQRYPIPWLLEDAATQLVKASMVFA